MSTVLGIYKIIRKIGRGAFGEVYLVADQEGNEWAVKEINKKKLDPDTRQYIYNEIKIMKQIKSEYVVSLHNSQENNEYIYIVVQFCNGRDLRIDMAKQPNKVYTLDQATRILVDVLRGLQAVHSKGFLHRDIKIENILVKIDESENKTYKIADFGLSKSSNIGETVLGTGNYMSPEFYSNKAYGFEVDMWAFGVCFYFMLNKEYPFKMSPHFEGDPEYQYNFLVEQAENFSYSEFVSKSKSKIMENCVPVVENLFKRFFVVDPTKRITFSQIRSHPLFKKYFQGENTEYLQTIYNSKVKVKDTKFPPAGNRKENIENENVGLRQSLALDLGVTQKFPKEKEYLFRHNNQVEFLYNNYKEFSESHGVLTKIEKMPLCYNLIKYYVILKRNFMQQIKSQAICKQEPKLNFSEYFKTISFKKQYRQFEEQLESAMSEFEALHEQCAESLEIIDKINSKFKNSFQMPIKENDFTDSFKQSYRKSTLFVFDKLKKFLKENNRGNTYNYYLALTVISHIFNRIFVEKENVAKVFKDFLEQQNVSVNNIDYDKLREWMSKATPMQLNGVTRNIITNYFEKSG